MNPKPDGLFRCAVQVCCGQPLIKSFIFQRETSEDGIRMWEICILKIN